MLFFLRAILIPFVIAFVLAVLVSALVQPREPKELYSLAK